MLWMASKTGTNLIMQLIKEMVVGRDLCTICDECFTNCKHPCYIGAEFSMKMFTFTLSTDALIVYLIRTFVNI